MIDTIILFPSIQKKIETGIFVFFTQASIDYTRICPGYIYQKASSPSSWSFNNQDFSVPHFFEEKIYGDQFSNRQKKGNPMIIYTIKKTIAVWF
jgi:hypothetical protein